MTQAHIHRIATAVPQHQVHERFIAFASQLLGEDRERTVFHRMAERSGIDRRYSALQVEPPFPADAIDANEFYRLGGFASTAQRMQAFEKLAPPLLHQALDRLQITEAERRGIRHVIVTCCTGHYAPGLDFAIIDHLGLSSDVSRTMIGFMGCYAAINGLQQAHHIVRSQPGEMVLMVNLELCTLHLQESHNIGELLSFLLFADGCTASLISGEPHGLAIDGFRSIRIAGTSELITWRIGDGGFLMHLSGQVPASIERLLREQAAQFTAGDPIALWAIHPGGKTVLDAVEHGLALAPDALAASRCVLQRYGNMSSATVMFVLARLMRDASSGKRGLAMSFGPGLTAETMEFHAV